MFFIQFPSLNYHIKPKIL